MLIKSLTFINAWCFDWIRFALGEVGPFQKPSKFQVDKWKANICHVLSVFESCLIAFEELLQTFLQVSFYSIARIIALHKKMVCR